MVYENSDNPQQLPTLTEGDTRDCSLCWQLHVSPEILGINTLCHFSTCVGFPLHWCGLFFPLSMLSSSLNDNRASSLTLQSLIQHVGMELIQPSNSKHHWAHAILSFINATTKTGDVYFLFFLLPCLPHFKSLSISLYRVPQFTFSPIS